MNDAAVHYNNAFKIRLAMGVPIVTDLTCGQIGYPCEFPTPDVCDGNPANTAKLPAESCQGFVEI